MPVLYETRNHVAYLTLSRPEARNCWGEDYNEALAEFCGKMAADDDVRVAVLTGDPAGGAFSAGANLKDPRTHTDPSIAAFIKNLPQRRRHAGQILTEFPKPVIAAVNGLAIGIGCIVTCCCDMIVASDQAEWRMPQVRLGLLPNHAGAARLARWIGHGEAMKVAMGFPLKAADAYRLGLAQWLVPHQEFRAQVAEIAERIADTPPLASRLVKESMNRGMDTTNIADAAYNDLYRFLALELTNDAQEGHSAWREKRTPEVRGS